MYDESWYEQVGSAREVRFQGCMSKNISGQEWISGRVAVQLAREYFEEFEVKINMFSLLINNIWPILI